MKGLRYVHAKKAKGKTYYYLDLGKDETGTRMLKRLPDVRSHGFTKAYQAALGQRTKRGNAESSSKDFDWLVRIYEKSPDFKALAENSKRLYSRHLGYANANFRSKTDRSWPLDIITAEQAVALRDKFADQPGKANATLKAIGALYAWAGKPGRGYVKSNIAAGIDQLETGEHEPWPDWLVEDALNDPEVRLPVALLYFLGQRIGDTVKLGRQSIGGGIVSLTQQKTAKPLRIAVHSRLAEIVAADAPEGSMLFLVNEHGKPLTESGLRQRLQAWALKKHKQHIVPHGLRKNAVNILLKAGCSVAEVAAITGQSLQMIEHYAKRRDGEHLSRAAIIRFEALDKKRTNDERANRS